MSIEVIQPFCNLETVKDGRGGIFTWLPKEPIVEFNLLFFKYNRSKIYAATEACPKNTSFIFISDLQCYVCIAEDWLNNEEIRFINGT